jgi:hypothetical protein
VNPPPVSGIEKRSTLDSTPETPLAKSTQEKTAKLPSASTPPPLHAEGRLAGSTTTGIDPLPASATIENRGTPKTALVKSVQGKAVNPRLHFILPNQEREWDYDNPSLRIFFNIQTALISLTSLALGLGTQIPLCHTLSLDSIGERETPFWFKGKEATNIRKKLKKGLRMSLLWLECR